MSLSLPFSPLDQEESVPPSPSPRASAPAQHTLTTYIRTHLTTHAPQEITQFLAHIAKYSAPDAIDSFRCDVLVFYFVKEEMRVEWLADAKSGGLKDIVMEGVYRMGVELLACGLQDFFPWTELAKQHRAAAEAENKSGQTVKPDSANAATPTENAPPAANATQPKSTKQWWKRRRSSSNRISPGVVDREAW
ncbi:hypothetical protein HK104_004107 [Borealophlyctis nickersoniae]|nr:hypothetical protein HK104_004107 [Borealophlyctis nickersoniae]